MTSYRDPRAASVEDYNDQSNETVPDTRKVADSRARRKSAVSSGALATVGDFASDSGYSSHAAATVASSDSTGLSYSNPSPNRSRYSMKSANPKRRPSASTSQKPAETRPELPRLKTGSSARSKSSTRASRHSHCDCKDCHPRAKTMPSPLDSGFDVNYPPFTRYPDQKPPPHPRKYSTEAPAVVQPARSRPQSLRQTPRPISYGGPGSFSEEEYIAAATAYEMEHGPPPSMSAFTNIPMPVSRRSSMAAYPPSPFTPSPTSFPEMYDLYGPPPRPHPSRRQSEHYAPRPSSLYGEPVIEYGYPPIPPPNHRGSLIDPYEALMPLTQEEEDYYRMPPPTIPLRRPSLRSSGSSKPRRESFRSVPISDTGATVMPPNKLERVRSSPRASPVHELSAQRRPPLSARSSGRRLKSYHDGVSGQTVQVASSREKEKSRARRASYYGHEKTKDLERNAEEYQEHVTKTTAAAATPLTAEALRGATRKVRPHGRLGSSHSTSSRESNEVKSTRSRPGSGIAGSIPETTESGMADAFTMRFNSGSAVKFDFEGRTIFVKSGGTNGEPAEVSIGSSSASSTPARLDRDGYGYADQRGVEYSRSGGRLRREIEEERRSRADTRSRADAATTRSSSSMRSSRRSSRGPSVGRGPPVEY